MGAIGGQVPLGLAGIRIGAVEQVTKHVEQVGKAPVMPGDLGPERDDGFVQFGVGPGALGLREAGLGQDLPGGHIFEALGLPGVMRAPIGFAGGPYLRQEPLIDGQGR